MIICEIDVIACDFGTFQVEYLLKGALQYYLFNFEPTYVKEFKAAVRVDLHVQHWTVLHKFITKHFRDSMTLAIKIALGVFAPYLVASAATPPPPPPLKILADYPSLC